jgi:hypothetical protein
MTITLLLALAVIMLVIDNVRLRMTDDKDNDTGTPVNRNLEPEHTLSNDYYTPMDIAPGTDSDSSPQASTQESEIPITPAVEPPASSSDQADESQ